jgi:hypothetical protein
MGAEHSNSPADEKERVFSADRALAGSAPYTAIDSADGPDTLDGIVTPGRIRVEDLTFARNESHS